uniref:Uncharacterized protein n=1 Tax=Myotis myotis TaxID=51298 RepID=A0A7J7SRK5_MYOMY|nr:hypothetical protein mMyoMyo1_009273 [Myotis myotis]
MVPFCQLLPHAHQSLLVKAFQGFMESTEQYWGDRPGASEVWSALNTVLLAPPRPGWWTPCGLPAWPCLQGQQPSPKSGQIGEWLIMFWALSGPDDAVRPHTVGGSGEGALEGAPLPVSLPPTPLHVTCTEPVCPCPGTCSPVATSSPVSHSCPVSTPSPSPVCTSSLSCSFKRRLRPKPVWLSG